MPQIELDGDNYVITLTEEILKELGWEVGDSLSFEDNGDGSVSLFKTSRWCYQCNKDRNVSFNRIDNPFAGTRMILCPKCSNECRPHATDHNYVCTKSNESGQPDKSLCLTI